MKSFKWVGLCLGMLFATQGFAADFKLGYVNIERVYREAKPARDIQQKLEKEFSSRRAELTVLQGKGKKLEAQLVRNDLADAARKNDQRDLDALIRDFNAKSAALSEDFNQRRNEEFAAFVDRANQVVKRLAVEGQYDLILQDSVYVSPKYDLTETLLKELDK
jgi:outer membrane protein